MKPVIIIPALNPDEKLIILVGKLKNAGLPVVVIDDGSQKNSAIIFEILKTQHNCEICTHPRNMGKGAALKTGIQFASTKYPKCIGYVTADADGQHAWEDILKVAEVLENNDKGLILGFRDFHDENIPFKSKWGNRITSWVFLLSTGQKCTDTQTGLRGIPKCYTDLCLHVLGERYEYEMNLLLEVGQKKIPIIYVPIETIYLENNQSSHFQPFRDSVTIYYHILKYSFSSLVSAITDILLFTIFVHLIFGSGVRGILLSTVTARFMSGSINFMLNKHFVFKSKASHTREARNYLILFCCQMLMSWLLVSTLSFLPLNLTFIKVFVDGSLFFISYQIQKRYIFKKKGASAKDEKLFLKTV